MSKIIPQETIDALRNFVDVSLDNYGIDCELYILTDSDLIDSHDAYSEIEEKTFTKYNTKVWIEWSPSMASLRKLGLFTEEKTTQTTLPIIARFKTQSDTFPDIPIGSYIKVNIQFVPKQYNTDSFEIINIFAGPFQDIQVVKQYLLSPRRVK